MESPDLSEEELKREILGIVEYCFNCRFCLPGCPLFEINQGWISQGASGITRALYYAIKWDEWDGVSKNELRDLLYACTTCKTCELTCKKMSTGVNLVEAIEKGRQLLRERMIGPMPEQRKALKSLMRYGNPYGFDPKERIKWAEELEVPLLRAGTHVDVILYVGCTAAYDFRLQKVAKAVALLMKKTQVRFAVIEDELCCGNPAHSMGDEGLFRDLSEKNVKQFNALGVGHIVTVSPHCFHTFLNEYPEAMRKIKVQHYTQFLADLTSHRQTLPIRKSRGMKKAVFHDPCYLGKHNSIYGEPRTILKSIPGLSLVEMKRSKQDSLCCGGGGGRMWADFTKEGRLSDLRIKEAMDAGAEAVVTACPFCIIHFEDAVKALAVENTVSVYDVAEYLAASLDSDEPFPS